MRPTTAAAGAAALLLAAGLAACSGDPEPGSPLHTGNPVPSATGTPGGQGSTSTAPTTPGAPSPSSEQPVAAPTLPPEATTNDAAGAEAFVRHWFNAVNYAYETLDAKALEGISDEACSVCASIASEVEDLASQGSAVSGGSYILDEVVAPAPDPTGVNIVSLVYTRQPLVQNNGSSTPSASQAPPVSVAAVIEWRGDQWRMYDFGQ